MARMLFSGAVMGTRPCLRAGCPEPAVPGNSRCVAHQRQHWGAKIASQPYRNYGGAWPATRKQVLAEEPTCRFCGAPSKDVDHITPLRSGGTHERSNLRALCRSCHRRVTLDVLKADWNRRREPSGQVTR